MVTVNIDVGEEADQGARANKASPIPLPAATNWIEALFLG